ncbi:MAG: hypothetical protein ACI9U2_003080, partial [Bradymonadia bacterium]
MRIVFPFVVVMWGCTAPFPALGPAFDAGVSDDAEVGAPPADAQPTDLGPTDAQEPDARAPDALPIDGGSPDAQPMDADVGGSPVDAAIDAQTPDAGPPPLAPLITEVVTANRGSLIDSDGATPDWIELHNPTGAALPVGAFTLSDDEDGPGWALPEATLAPFETRIVFASGADRRGAEWHTDFRLGAAGEVLRLTTLDGATVQRLDIPALGVDVAFGLPAVPVVAVDEPVRYRSPGADDGWMEPAYDDSAWMIAPQGIGVDEPAQFGIRITTRLPADTLPAQVRIAWPAAPWLALNLAADVVPSAQLWIDGALVDPLNAPSERGLPAGATALAIAVDAGEDSWLVRAKVDGLHAQPVVLERPTPGVFNAAGLSPSVNFSRADGVFEGNFMLTLQSAAEAIHYTLD